MSIRTRIGLLVPSPNTTCEPDFYRVMPSTVSVHTNRLWLTNDEDDKDGIDRMNSEAEKAASYLRTAAVDAIAYGCTTGSFYKGAGYDDELLTIIEEASGAPSVATAPASVEALKQLGAKKISVATPYPEWNNRQLKIYYEALGFEILNVDAEPVASVAGSQGINDQDPESVLKFAASVCDPDADVLFCSCTAWRSFEIVEALEEAVGKPVITSNQVTAWAIMKRLDLEPINSSFGSLFELTS